MTSFKIATWNVNSLRVRLPQVLAWLNNVKPDVLALQETKLSNEDFPVDIIQAAGYEVVFSGQRTYNGVALLSRKKALDIVFDLPDFNDPQRRILAAVVGNVRVLNLYVPNGENIVSEKYQYKLDWLKNLDLFLKYEITKHPNLIVLGDFNIAPEEIDVHHPDSWREQILFSQKERQAFRDMLQVGFVDCFRYVNPAEQGFSWWDYRMNAFKRNLGLRIDHILANSMLASSCVKCYIDKNPRGQDRPSDHAPVVAEFNLLA